VKGFEMMKQEYIQEINDLLQQANIETLDFIFQLLNKSVKKPATPSEINQQSA
jgi:hypothetical protein